MSENNEFKRLAKKIFIKGKIITETGLHIGGSSLGMSIGGADSVVIRNPVNNEPYIPGSSLKGKMRSLAEKVEGHLNDEIKDSNIVGYGPTRDPNSWIGKLFGISAAEANNPPTRLIVRDSKLINEKTLAEAENTDMPYSEVKTEVVIDRLTAQATPRQIERVPAGAEFELDLVLNVYKDDDEEENINHVFNCLKLVQDDYLGGNGTRGYGKVSFQISGLTCRDKNAYENDLDAFELEIEVPENLR